MEDCGRLSRPRRKWGRVGSTYSVGPPLAPTEMGENSAQSDHFGTSSSRLQTIPFPDSLANRSIFQSRQSSLIFRRWSLVISLQLNHTVKPGVKPWSYWVRLVRPDRVLGQDRGRQMGPSVFPNLSDTWFRKQISQVPGLHLTTGGNPSPISPPILRCREPMIRW